jgi:hypothetical protein
MKGEIQSGHLLDTSPERHRYTDTACPASNGSVKEEDTLEVFEKRGAEGNIGT